jgi:hypothetical protein
VHLPSSPPAAAFCFQLHADTIQALLGNGTGGFDEVLAYAEGAQQVIETLVGVSDPKGAFVLILDIFEVGNELWTHMLGRCKLLCDLLEAFLHQPVAQVTAPESRSSKKT